MAPILIYVVTEDWYFLSHRLPMARAARDAGFDVHVATRLSRYRAVIEDEGFCFHALAWTRGSLDTRDSLRAIRELRQLFRQVCPDIVHNVAIKPAVLGSIASLGLSLVVVNSLTGLGSLFIGQGTGQRTKCAVELALRLLLRRRNSATIVQNPDDHAFVLSLGASPKQVSIIRGSGVDTQHFLPLSEPSPPITAAYVGRMLADKGVRTLLAAYSRIREQDFQLGLILAGDCDPENPSSLSPDELGDAVRRLGVEWLGHVTDIRDVWRRAHFAVLASRREGLPKNLLEAAACGRSMIATEAPGCREIAIEGETALTVPVDDAEALSSAMVRMANDAAMRQRFGHSARKLVEAEFSAEVIGRETVALYERLMRRP